MIDHFLVILLADDTVGRGYTLEDALSDARRRARRVSVHAEVLRAAAPTRHALDALSVDRVGRITYPQGSQLTGEVIKL